MDYATWHKMNAEPNDFYGDRGSPDSPSIWVLGIEPGWSKSDQTPDDGVRSIEVQLRWPFHRNIFKLAAVIEGLPLEDSVQFAKQRQLFVPGARSGYMRGNLFPACCNNVAEWSQEQIDQTGFPTKDAYREWCRNERWPRIAALVGSLTPRLVIGVGISCRDDFAAAVLGEGIPLEERSFAIGKHTKRLFFTSDKGRKLVVTPHTSGRYGLNSNKAIEEAGHRIAEFMKA